jgi:CRISPR-associated protein Cmr5
MTRQQKWAAGALARVLAQKDTPNAGVYRTLCLKMPILIKQSGLVQALAFMWSRDKEDADMGTQAPGKTFCKDLAEVYGISDSEAGRTLLQSAQQAGDLASYLLMTRELIDISVWFRRFAQSELPNQGEP